MQAVKEETNQVPVKVETGSIDLTMDEQEELLTTQLTILREKRKRIEPVIRAVQESGLSFAEVIALLTPDAQRETKRANLCTNAKL
jgi:hypothetical protein